MLQFARNAPPSTPPGELYPTRYRATCHGLSAAAGKFGAILGVYVFGAIKSRYGVRAALGWLVAPLGLGVLTTLLVPETKARGCCRVLNASGL